jgi:hypothetical protein
VGKETPKKFPQNQRARDGSARERLPVALRPPNSARAFPCPRAQTSWSTVATGARLGRETDPTPPAVARRILPASGPRDRARRARRPGRAAGTPPCRSAPTDGGSRGSVYSTLGRRSIVYTAAKHRAGEFRPGGGFQQARRIAANRPPRTTKVTDLILNLIKMRTRAKRGGWALPDRVPGPSPRSGGPRPGGSRLGAGRTRAESRSSRPPGALNGTKGRRYTASGGAGRWGTAASGRRGRLPEGAPGSRCLAGRDQIIFETDAKRGSSEKLYSYRKANTRVSF